MEGTTVTVATLMDNAASVFSSVMTMVGNVVDTIVDKPILLLACVGVPLCGIGVGMLKRLLSARA